MSSSQIAQISDPLHTQPLSLRARLLLRLERYFPVLDAPRDRGQHAAFEYRKASGSYGSHAKEIGGLAGKRVLDFGCGWGGETVWLAEQALEAVGCDVNADALADARSFVEQAGCRNARFVACTAEGLPLPDDHFDAVFSTNVFEHVMDIPAMLSEIRRVLKPGGSLVTRFGPLFYSPLGYHLCWATQVPYAHLWAGLGPMMEVRNLRRGPIHPRSWEETGLNRVTFGRFRRAVRQSGLLIRRLDRVPVRQCAMLAKLPLVGDLLTFGVDCHLVKSE
ncbi:MAG: class I SAM-dependent methyltransferase [Phycisphaeraceae bacterium]|nr:class I SAM-dependent methyltransferase [Phycisphaeraceae bacterium]